MSHSLDQQLQSAKTEEDVKDAYIRALNLKKYSKGLVDITTEEIWFEAKESPTPIANMFSQLLWYVREAREKGLTIPPFLSVVDREKAAIMETENALPVFADKKIKWAKNASLVGVDKVLINQISPYIEAHFTVFHIDQDEAEFIRTVKAAIAKGAIIRAAITPDNLRQVFDKWVEMIGVELEGVKERDYALLFFADIMFDPTIGKASEKDLTARLFMEGENPVFMLHGQTCELATVRGYRRFWSFYHRPPDKAHRNYLLARRDSLLPLDERSFKGAFYTPLKVVDKAYDLLSETLGKNWQQNYIVWDPCCGVGNLEVKHNYHRNVFMSTLDKADVDVMQTNKHLFAESTRFQYDYLNDDINAAGEIDYTLTGKMPKELQQAIADAKAKKKGAKKILILMNPPYAEAANSQGNEGKTDVAKTNIGVLMNKDDYGYAARELFVQFMARIAKELPEAVLAMFSTLKYVNAPNFENFRKAWHAKYLNGFVVHSKAFDGINGNFPIGFLVWQTLNSPSLEGATRPWVVPQRGGVASNIITNINNSTAPQDEATPSRLVAAPPLLKKGNLTLPAVSVINVAEKIITEGFKFIPRQTPKSGARKLNDLPFNPELQEKAKALRKAGILSEVLMWKALKQKQLSGLDFDRQKVIGNYIVDFYCHTARLVVEIDGLSHDNKVEYDDKRDDYLSSLGLNILHFADSRVRKDIHDVLSTIQRYALSISAELNSPSLEGVPQRGEVASNITTDLNSPSLEGATRPWAVPQRGGVASNIITDLNSPSLEGVPQRGGVASNIITNINNSTAPQDEATPQSKNSWATPSRLVAAPPLLKKGNLIEPMINMVDEITVRVLDKNADFIGEKRFFNLPPSRYLNLWITRLKTDSINIPLKNAVTPQTAHAKVTTWVSSAIGYLLSNSNDPQNAGTLTALFSSVYSAGNGYYVTPENLWQAAIVFSVRRLIKPTWLNDRDQFLQPTGELTNEFKHDCLIWMLFNGSNLTASANHLEWNGKKWSIVNHFIPFTESEVGAGGKFESDFMVQYLRGKKLSAEAKAVLMVGKALWQAYFKNEFERKIRDELKLNRPDVGWYQIRNALRTATTNGDINVDFTAFEKAYQALSDKLRPQVYLLGFLK